MCTTSLLSTHQAHDQRSIARATSIAASLLSAAVLLSSCVTDYKIQALEEDRRDLSEEPGLDTGGADPVDLDAPIAVCSVSTDTVRPPTGTTTFDGTSSYDPKDLALVAYDWTLVSQPVGSAVGMPVGGASRTQFTPDLAGEYIGRLVVENEAGLTSEPCEVTVYSDPVEELWVEMFWQLTGDDMDLHLIAPGGAMNTTSDCYWETCDSSIGLGLDWGIIGDTDDDPSLDLDDIADTGPENVNIERPEEGSYTVVVHDFPNSIVDTGNAVTVRIYIDGFLEWSDTRIISGEDTETSFARIDAVSGTVTGID